MNRVLKTGGRRRRRKKKIDENDLKSRSVVVNRLALHRPLLLIPRKPTTLSLFKENEKLKEAKRFMTLKNFLIPLLDLHSKEGRKAGFAFFLAPSFFEEEKRLNRPNFTLPARERRRKDGR